MALLRTKEAAEALGLKDDTIRAWAATRKISSVKLGGALRIPSEEVDRLIREGTVPAVKKRGAR